MCRYMCIGVCMQGCVCRCVFAGVCVCRGMCVCICRCVYVEDRSTLDVTPQTPPTFFNGVCTHT